MKAAEWTAQRRQKRKRKTRVSRKKQLQRLNPTEDEKKLQTKQFVELCGSRKAETRAEDCGYMSGLDRKVGATFLLTLL